MSAGPGSLLVDVAEHADIESTMTAVRDTLRAWVGAGPAFIATADPISGSFTDTFTFDIPAEAATAFYAIEVSGRDVVAFDALRGTPQPVGSLYAATAARPAASKRWREVIAPSGWGDELRAVVRAHGSTWAYLCLHREAGERAFDTRDITRLGMLLPAIGAAMRRAALPSREGTARLDTGVVVVDRAGRIVAATVAANAWLDEMGQRARDGLPLLLLGLTSLVLDSGRAVSRSITTRTGRAGVVDAAPLHSDRDPQVAIVMSAAAPRHQLERLAAASALTAREHEIVSCVLEGLSTRAIADQLTISPHTRPGIPDLGIHQDRRTQQTRTHLQPDPVSVATIMPIPR